MHCEAVNGFRKTIIHKGIALAFYVGAMLFVCSAHAYASDMVQEQMVPETVQKGGLWDSYKQPVGFTYGAQARVQTAYLWRGMYSGGANIQASANVGYGGLYADLWWNIGVTDWRFNTFQPEMDISIGFKRWGLNIFLLYVHNFNCGMFDFANYPDKGNRLAIDVCYTLSDKVPLGFVWETRVAAADAYVNAAGDTVRAYSSYAEIHYTHDFGKGWSLFGAVGITPWRSTYTFYEREFAVQNVELRLRKDWAVSKYCGLMLQGQLSVNPSAIAADKSSAQWRPYSPSRQSVNANLAFGVYLR